MRILVSAYSCRPNEGSEQGAAWNILTRLSQQHRLWVLTRARHRDVIETHLATHPQPTITFVYHDISPLLILKPLPGGFYWYHYLWQLSLSGIARRLHQEVGFDAAHQLTIGSFRFPSGLRRLGMPLIVGPVGGAEEAPSAFWPQLGIRGVISESLRWLSNRWATRDPLVRSTYRSATVVLAVTEATKRRLAKIAGAPEAMILPQSGLDPQAVIGRGEKRDPDGDIDVLFVGRLVPWKGAHLAVRAYAKAKATFPRMRLTILGTGPAEKMIRSIIEDEAIQDVSMPGRLPDIEDVYELYRRSDVFLFPSLHESGGMAVLEAMGAGLPVVCLDIGGPAATVTSMTGVVIPAKSPDQVISAMAMALIDMASDVEMRTAMGAAARKRVAEYGWDRKVAALDRLIRGLNHG